VSSQPTIHRDLLIKKNELIAVLETKVNVVIQKSIDFAIVWMTQILSKQKKFDYKPKDNEVVSIAGLSSTVCYLLYLYILALFVSVLW
jgi:exocyst complex component 5